MYDILSPVVRYHFKSVSVSDILYPIVRYNFHLFTIDQKLCHDFSGSGKCKFECISGVLSLYTLSQCTRHNYHVSLSACDSTYTRSSSQQLAKLAVGKFSRVSHTPMCHVCSVVYMLLEKAAGTVIARFLSSIIRIITLCHFR